MSWLHGEGLRFQSHPWSPRIGHGVATAGPDWRRGGRPMARASDVTAREAEVLALIARHLTNAQIAESLFISQRTVESHVSAMLRKLQLPDRRSLARHADGLPARADRVRPGQPAGAGHAVRRSGRRAGGAGRGARRRTAWSPRPVRAASARPGWRSASPPSRRRAPRRGVVRRPGPRDRPATVVAAVAETVGVPEQRSTSIELALVASLAGRDAPARARQLRARPRRRPGLRRADPRPAAPTSRCWRPAGPACCVPYERVYAVPGLSVADGGGDAVDLFAARVAAATGEPARRTGAAWPPCAGRWTAWRWPSSWPRPGTRRSGWTGSRRGLDERLRFLTGGTGSPTGTLAARRHRLELRAPRPDDRRCCAASPCSHHGSTSTRPTPSAGCDRDRRGGRRAGPPRRATACSSSGAASRPATGRWRRSASTASSSSPRPASWTPSAPATSSGAGWSLTGAAARRGHRRVLVRPRSTG